MYLFNTTIRLTIVFLLFLCLGFATRSLAQEQITSFHSKVEVADNGVLTVTETIKVKAEGRDIRRGIYRDFPTVFKDKNGQKKKVTFKLLSTLRDGEKDRNKVESHSEYVRIYIGKSDVFLEHGNYTYTIKYETDRQMRFFNTHDELFWNVTGNFWKFPIQRASAEFHLPKNTKILEKKGYTGGHGSREQNLEISVHSHPTIVRAKSTKRLGPREGMSVAMKMPTGTFTITKAQESAWFWNHNKVEIVSLIGLFIVTLYYLISWWWVGRDPEEGVVVPRWKAPDGLSPALVDYIDKKGLSGHGFSAITAALLSLGVKGLVRLEKPRGDLQIISTKQEPSEQLPTGEQAIFNLVKWESSGGTFDVSDNNSLAVKNMQTKFANAMEKEHRNKYYIFNWLNIAFGIFLSIFALVIPFLMMDQAEQKQLFVIVPFVIGGLFFVFVFMRSFKNFAIGRVSGLISKIFRLFFMGFVSLIISGNIFNLIITNMSSESLSSTPVILLATILMLNVLFYFLLGAPTPLGRKRMDEIEGLKTYLSLVEKDRMNMKGAPDFTTQHYEELLPYAVALGVEKPWTNTLNVFLTSSLATGAAASYSPHWYPSYHGRSGNTFDDLSSSIENGFADSMPVAESSSSGFSGGGGVSGGGGGGGGGGGW